MNTIDLTRDIFADLFEDDDPDTLNFLGENPHFADCPGCDGKGRYVGFRAVEDPCEVCQGSGRIRKDG